MRHVGRLIWQSGVSSAAPDGRVVDGVRLEALGQAVGTKARKRVAMPSCAGV
jgi:hypothetical protein